MSVWVERGRRSVRDGLPAGWRPELLRRRLPGASFRRLAYGLSAVVIGIIVIEWIRWIAQHQDVLAQEIGIDYRIYTDAAARWLAGGSFYPTYQLAGPYDLVPPAVLYPPTIMPLLLPFLVLPALLWWLIPISLTVVCLVRLRPAPWSWPLILGGLAFGQATLIHGTPTLWILAAVAVATQRGGAGALVLVKPSVAPFALIGIQSRSWWMVAAALTGMGLLMLPMWLDWLTVLRNATGPHATLLYSLQDVPILAIPVWARLARRQGVSEGRSQGAESRQFASSSGRRGRMKTVKALPPEVNVTPACAVATTAPSRVASSPRTTP